MGGAEDKFEFPNNVTQISMDKEHASKKIIPSKISLAGFSSVPYFDANNLMASTIPTSSEIFEYYNKEAATVGDIDSTEQISPTQNSPYYLKFNSPDSADSVEVNYPPSVPQLFSVDERKQSAPVKADFQSNSEPKKKLDSFQELKAKILSRNRSPSPPQLLGFDESPCLIRDFRSCSSDYGSTAAFRHLLGSARLQAGKTHQVNC